MRLFRLLVVALVLMAGCVHTGRVAFGQAVGLEMGVPQFFDSNGNPLNGGKLYSYSAGSSSQLFLYTNKELNIPYADPLVLNSAGRPAGPVYMQNYPYKLELYTSAGVLVWTADYQYPSSVFAGGWYNTSGVFLRPVSTNSDVLIGSATAADCCSANGRLEIVGTSMRVLSDATANSNYLAVRSTGGAIVFEGLLNGTATHIPMQWRDGCGSSTCMTLSGAASTSALTLGNTTSGGAGVLSIVSPTSSATYTAQGVTSNSVMSTGAYFGVASAPVPLDVNIPLYVKRTTGSTMARFETGSTSGVLAMNFGGTANTVTWFGSTTSTSISLGSNNADMGVYESSVCGTGFSCFLVNSGSAGNVFLADATSNAATTNIMIYHNGSLVRVGLGNADSCTAGWRCLRVLN